MVCCRDCSAEQELGPSIETDHKPGSVEARGIAGLVLLLGRLLLVLLLGRLLLGRLLLGRLLLGRAVIWRCSSRRLNRNNHIAGRTFALLPDQSSRKIHFVRTVGALEIYYRHFVWHPMLASGSIHHHNLYA